MAATKALLTTAEVADRLGWSIAKVNRKAAVGVLPVAQKLPGLTGANLFDRADVELLTEQPAQQTA